MRNRGDPVSTFSCPKEVNEMKKRIFAAIMAFCMVFALTACGESGGEKASPSPQSGGEPEVTPPFRSALESHMYLPPCFPG